MVFAFLERRSDESTSKDFEVKNVLLRVVNLNTLLVEYTVKSNPVCYHVYIIYMYRKTSLQRNRLEPTINHYRIISYRKVLLYIIYYTRVIRFTREK